MRLSAGKTERYGGGGEGIWNLEKKIGQAEEVWAHLTWLGRPIYS